MGDAGNNYPQQPMQGERTMYPQSPIPDERHIYTQSPVNYGGTTNFTAVNVMAPGMMVPLDGQPMWTSNVFTSTLPVAEARMGKQSFYPPGDRELKNCHVRNGQPTPPPFDDKRVPQQMTATAATGMYSVASSTFQFSPAVPANPMYYSPPEQFDTAAPGPSPSPTGGRRRRKIEEVDDGASDNHHLEEKAKRQKFLERNRVAASKCRQKKKIQTQFLEQRCEAAIRKKEFLEKEVNRLRHVVISLKMQLLAHANCGNPAIDQQLEKMVRTIFTPEDSQKKEKSSPPKIDVSAAVPMLESKLMSFGFDGSECSVPSSDIEPSSFTDQPPGMSDESETSYLNDTSFTFDPDDTTFDDFINQDE